MQRGLALFFKFEHGSPILGFQLKNRQAGASSPGAPELSDPDLPAPRERERELDGGTSADRPRFLRSMLGLEVGVEIGKLEQQPATVASRLELAELHKVVKPVA
jgi:hypothetical protein